MSITTRVLKYKIYILNCNNYFFIYFIKYSKSIEKVVNICMKSLQEKKLSSISFPAIGTGNLGYPAQIVAQNMILSVQKYLTDNPNESFAVNLVLSPQFTDILKVNLLF